jgi:hypothetical protein
MPESSEPFTPQQIAKGEEVFAYYSQDSLPEPDDNETVRPSPFLQIQQKQISKRITEDERT